ncbi:hypothetical protein Ddye_027685 [Dipteronia dyeriana]|uniref:Reverse transcriptase domain-containing protein n=1 Tax=Dipteronia dyeriana TaxID=168575 RepID=A0AAD9TPK8_9ROSI|nr:hypothetical protein Ddye_027685 [Dipteronia dyeriana]
MEEGYGGAKKVIDDIQMVFVDNRQILDSFLVAEEIVHKWRRDKEGRLLVKLNFEKAYDSVDHSFLDNMLEAMGFGLKWRSWIRCCIESPTLSVLLEVARSSSDSFFIKAVGSVYENRSTSAKVVNEGLKVVIRRGNKACFWGDIGQDSVPLKRVFQGFLPWQGIKRGLFKTSAFGMALFWFGM